MYADLQRHLHATAALSALSTRIMKAIIAQSCSRRVPRHVYTLQAKPYGARARCCCSAPNRGVASPRDVDRAETCGPWPDRRKRRLLTVGPLPLSSSPVFPSTLSWHPSPLLSLLSLSLSQLLPNLFTTSRPCPLSIRGRQTTIVLCWGRQQPQTHVISLTYGFHAPVYADITKCRLYTRPGDGL
ncbi:hypothetical protein BU24DRAFT_115771 [Aaosphaeria arxii CBS 175.79]|uniref:Uncharacterized protein n=1 Tax=Aaosphaeria arxii CBS 175.79 TaxID=1450172 RepID=A0A6A5Y216_9PLEO|nr:uncharacterized protein BU24DRAFT_115771 [Aaosphaeria arxii CBS 175.79]KAF2019269.1 hypothetical protein BU24DRAFT_115771 [Aaosphaeria arxii CBS 175.79]